MSTPHNTESRTALKEFLLAEYKNVADSFWKNEQTGETRVNWFLGIITAGAAGLIGLASAEHRPHGEPLRLIYLSALFAMLCFGIVTLFRIIKRNKHTDGYKKDTERIRELVKKLFDDNGALKDYRSFGPEESDKGFVRTFGGLAHTVSTINSLIVAGLAATIVYPFGGVSLVANRKDQILLTYPTALVVFLLAAFLQYKWIERKERKRK
jgi:hypothetical protein